MSTEPATGASASARPTGAGRAVNIILGAALVLAVGGIAFAAGRATAPAPAIGPGIGLPGGGPGGNNGGFPGGGPGGNNGGFPGGGFGSGPSIEGKVVALTSTTLTLELADGQTVQITLKDDTTYHARSDASAGDIVSGGTVIVRVDIGARGTDPGSGTVGTLAASDVTIAP